MTDAPLPSEAETRPEAGAMPPAPAPARIQIALLVKSSWQSAWRKNKATHLASYLLLALFLIPMGFMLGGFAKEAAAEPEATKGENLLGLMLLGFLFFKGFLAGTMQPDVTKFFLYPVSHRTVLAATALTQALAPSAILFLGLFVGYALYDPYSVRWVAFCALFVGVFMALVHTIALLLQLVVANLFRSRLLRDLGTVLGSLLVVGVYLGVHLLRQPGVQKGVEGLLEQIRPLLVVVPSTWIARALHVGGGLEAFLYLLAVVVVTAGLIAIAVRLQRMAFFGEIAFYTPQGGRSARALGWSWRLRLFSTEIGAAVAKEFQTLRRDPLVKDLLIRQIGIVLIPLIAVFLGTDAPRLPHAVVLLVLYILLLGETVILFNFFALDDRGVAALFATSVPRWKILVGKDLAFLLLLMPLNVGIAVAALFLLKEPGYIPFAVALGINTMVAVLAVGNFASVRLPYALLARRRNPLSSGAHQQAGCLHWFLRSALLAVALLFSAPIGLLIAVPLMMDGTGSYVWTLPVTTLYSVTLLAVTLPVAARHLEEHEEGLLNTFAWRK